MEALVLAGGLGTRLRDRVRDLPKPMAPIGGRPFLAFVLDRLVGAGCRRVVLATGYLSDKIEASFGSAYRGMPLHYSREVEPLGTGGAIVRASAAFDDAPFLVLNGDTWFGFDLARFVAWCRGRTPPDALVLRQVADTSRYGAVRLRGDVVDAFGEKSAAGPGLISAGVYLMRRATFSGFVLPQAFSIEHEFFQPHARRLGLGGYVADGAFIDIGVPADYDRAQVELPRWAGSAASPQAPEEQR